MFFSGRGVEGWLLLNTLMQCQWVALITLNRCRLVLSLSVCLETGIETELDDFPLPNVLEINSLNIAVTRGAACGDGAASREDPDGRPRRDHQDCLLRPVFPPPGILHDRRLLPRSGRRSTAGLACGGLGLGGENRRALLEQLFQALHCHVHHLDGGGVELQRAAAVVNWNVGLAQLRQVHRH